MFKNRMLHSSLSVCSELFTDVEEAGKTPGLWSAGTRQRLVDGVRQVQQQAHRRTELGDSNVRLHMTISMTLARVNASGDEHSVLMEMANSAKTSLKMSYAILQTRAMPAVDAEGAYQNITDLAEISPDHLDLDLDFDAFLGDPIFGNTFMSGDAST